MMKCFRCDNKADPAKALEFVRLRSRARLRLCDDCAKSLMRWWGQPEVRAMRDDEIVMPPELFDLDDLK